MPSDVEYAARLPLGLASAREARCLVRRAVEADVGEETLDTIELLTSEVVTNALLHAGTPPLVVVARRGRTVRVTVEDHSPMWPTIHDAPEGSASGRGVALVDALASSWGVERLTDNAKRVWFEVGPEHGWRG